MALTMPPRHSAASPVALSFCPPPPGLHAVLTYSPQPMGATLGPQEPVKLLRTAGGRLTLATMSGLEAVLAPKIAASDGDASTRAATPSAASQASDCNESVGSAREEEPTKKKRSRFCKAKRDHYRRLVEQLVQVARENPSGFSLDAVRLPKSIACSEEAKDKLLATVARFAAANAAE